MIAAAVLGFLAPRTLLSVEEIDAQEDEREAKKAALEDSHDPVPAGARLADERVSAFVLAGNARFTVVSKVTGKRFTFRVQTSKAPSAAPGVFFVSVLTGSCNESDYTFLGTIFGGKRFVHGRRSKIGQGAPSAKAFAWFWAALSVRAVVPATCEVWHEGRCGKCGRALTDPESIAMGLGPKCGASE